MATNSWSINSWNGNRRTWLRGMAASAATWLVSPLVSDRHLLANGADSGTGLRLAPFRFTVTPPLGHGCCGGWIKPVEAVDDELEALGFVLLGAGEPIVLCAVDWTGLLNEAHQLWRQALADAAGTRLERVAVQCVHQHNAPFACLDAERMVTEQGDLPHLLDLDFFQQCLQRARDAVTRALQQSRPVTHLATGQGQVQQVASNRRVHRDEQGKVINMRGSSCTDAQLRELPEGLIDPWLKTVAFYDGEERIAACHYYATHPMSYYGDGRVSSDFAGLARKQRQQADPHCLHLYFTACAGNIAAGKYNDGSPAQRAVLQGRMFAGLLAAEQQLQKQPLTDVAWRTVELIPTANPSLQAEQLEQLISNRSNSVVVRNRSTYMLAWLRRLQQQTPLSLSSLQLNHATLLHLPGECFVEYQLRAQQSAPAQFVACAAYGDGGPWYIPTAIEYPQGGYEVSMAFSDQQIDAALAEAMTRLLAAG